MDYDSRSRNFQTKRVDALLGVGRVDALPGATQTERVDAHPGVGRVDVPPCSSWVTSCELRLLASCSCIPVTRKPTRCQSVARTTTTNCDSEYVEDTVDTKTGHWRTSSPTSRRFSSCAISTSPFPSESPTKTLNWRPPLPRLLLRGTLPVLLCLLLALLGECVGARSEADLAPKIKQRFRSVWRVPLGERVKFRCPVSGDPKPFTTWSINDTDISTADHTLGPRLHIQRFSLAIDDVRWQDAGYYKVVAENQFGTGGFQA
jgi:hypothetical protein